MNLFFAAIGYELWDNALKAHDGEQMKVLFSFYDITESGFKFRRISWNKFKVPGTFNFLVKTKYLRLVITRAPHNISRVWEVEFYQPPKDEK